MTVFRRFSGGLCDNKNVEGRLQNCRVFGGERGREGWGGEENVEGQGCGRRVILDKDVFNDAIEHIGTIEDLIVTRDKGISDASIGVGGFPGMDATLPPSVIISVKSQTSASSFLVRAKKLSNRC